MEGRSYGNASFGVMVSPDAGLAVSQEERRLFYRTSSEQALPPRKLPALARTENVSDVHGIGQKRTPHLGVRLNVAKLQDRSICAYTENFHEHPLGDASTNTQLAAVFKGVKKHVSQPNLGGKTAYAEAFGARPSRREMKSASKRAKVPKQPRARDTLGFGSDKSTETRSHTHCLHGPMPSEMSASCERWVVKETLGLPIDSIQEAYRTQYQHEFKPSTAPSEMCRSSQQEIFRGMRVRTPGGIQEPLPMKLMPYASPAGEL
eukprot:gb/GFBE01061536.1/.p1 GENE.gb/GFBE01061536.1/~~gb/GFBE01061536.1/.p1  ORF type:complete len:262 (+),score=39.54 gb/GFBE01061536.1/:1-786(+)